jgi:hypothetical protein
MLYGKKLSHFFTFFSFRTRKVEKSGWFYFFSSFKKLEKKVRQFYTFTPFKLLPKIQIHRMRSWLACTFYHAHITKVLTSNTKSIWQFLWPFQTFRVKTEDTEKHKTTSTHKGQ